jgi:hypothetical protein
VPNSVDTARLMAGTKTPRHSGAMQQSCTLCLSFACQLLVTCLMCCQLVDKWNIATYVSS